MNDGQQKLRVLVVENEMLLRLTAEDLLEELGHEIVGWASRAGGAVAEAERAQPDVVLMDIQLDGSGDGIEAAHEIRNRFGIASVFMTGMSDKETYQRAVTAKPVAYLRKPLSLPDLKTAFVRFAGNGQEGSAAV